MNGKSTVKSLIALTMAGAMVFSMNTMPVSAAKKKTKAKSTVKSVKVVAPSGSKKSATVAKGKSIKLAVTVNATKKAYKKVTYKVSNKKVISVSKKGVVKGKKAGTATVKVISTKNKKKKASIKIKVVSGAVKTVKLNKSSLALNVGDSGKLSAKVTASKKAYKTLKWTTSNKKVATVTNKGVVKGIGKGTAKITAASLDGTGKKSTCTVTVREKQVVNGIKSLEVYNPLKSYSSSTLKVTLDSPQALTANDFKVETKSYGEGSYMRTVSVDDIYTTDNQTYEVYLANDDIYNGRYVRVTVNALNGQKTAEVRFLVDPDTVRQVHTAKVGDDEHSFSVDDAAAMGTSRSVIKTGTLPAGYKLINELGDSARVRGIPSAVADNQHVVFATTDELGRDTTTDVNFLIGDDDHIVVENQTIGDQVSGMIYAKDSFYKDLHFAGGNGKITAEILNTYDGTFKIDDTYSDSVGITVADSNKLAAGTYDIPVRITDSNGKTGQGTLKVIVTTSAKIVTKVNNNSPDGTIYFYNHNSNEEFSLRSIEKESKYSGSVGNTTLTSTGYLPHGTYSVYYRMCGRKIMLNKSLNVSGDTNLEFTLPTTKITGTIYDVNNKKYENSVDVCMYRSNDLDTRYYSVSDYTSDGTYSFQGVPDGQYVLVVSGQKDGKYFETTSGTITVSGGNATMDVKLPVANPANPQQ